MKVGSCRAWVFLAVLMLSAPGVAELPGTIKVQPGYQPSANSKWDEQGLWMEMQSAEADLTRSPLVLSNTPLSRYIEVLTCRVAGEYCDDVRVYTIQNPHLNASMAPNGTMIVHTGLILRVSSSDELAAVIGHELAHYTQAHSLRRFRAAKNRSTMGSLVSMGLAAGGINSSGLPEIIALASIMGFTRSQETEADVLGAYFMEQAQYNSAASAAVWFNVQEEERRASVKYPKGPLWLSSHPSPDRRAARLSALASARLEHREAASGPDPLVAALANEYRSLMMLLVQQGDHGRLMSILDRHELAGHDKSEIAFFRGEAWRLRRGAGDHEHAMRAYEVAIEANDTHGPAYRELGNLKLKHDSQEAAKPFYEQYLLLEPNATDREMIEFYIDGGW